jgi:hypothetical protein
MSFLWVNICAFVVPMPMLTSCVTVKWSLLAAQPLNYLSSTRYLTKHHSAGEPRRGGHAF